MAAGAPGSFAQQSGVPTLAGGPSPAAGGGLLGGSAPGPVAAQGSGPGLIGLGMPALPPGTVRVADSNSGLPGTTPAVPEPGSWAMIAAGLLVIAYRVGRRR